MLTATDMEKIEALQQALRRISPELGYREVPGSRRQRFKVRGNPLGESVAGSAYREIEVSAERLLKEMETLALYYKIQPPDVYSQLHVSRREGHPEPEPWLTPEARLAWRTATVGKVEPGVHRFGDEILIPMKEGPGYKTRQQILWVRSDRRRIEAFPYAPVDRDHPAYKSPARYLGAMDWNRSMYIYVEEDRMSPQEARNRLASLGKDLEKQLILEILKGHNPLPTFATPD